MEPKIRTFETGATRDTDNDKIDPEGFLSSLVIHRYCEYMMKHRLQPDGSIRASDNWQKGIPLGVYMKSAWRHFLEMWHCHRQDHPDQEVLEDAICGVMFNVMGYLHEQLKARGYQHRSLLTPINSCTCPVTCDCRHYPTVASNLCPVHNDKPEPSPNCPVFGQHNNGALDT